MLKQKDVIIVHVPQIKGLRVNQILEMARQYTNIDDYMPDLKDDKMPNGDFVSNVGKSLHDYT